MNQTQNQSKLSNQEKLQIMAGRIRGLSQESIVETLGIQPDAYANTVSNYRFKQVFRGNLKSETNNVNVVVAKDNNQILGYLYGMEPACSYPDLVTILTNHDFTKSMINHIQSEIENARIAPTVDKTLVKKEPVHVASESRYTKTASSVSDNEIIEALRTQRPSEVAETLNVDLTRVYRVRFVFQETQQLLTPVVNPQKKQTMSRYTRPSQKKKFVHDGVTYKNREEFIGKNYPKFNFMQLARLTGLSWHSVRVYYQKYLRTRRLDDRKAYESKNIVALGHDFPTITSAVDYLSSRLTIKATATELHVPIERVREVRNEIAEKTGKRLPLIKRNRNSETVEIIGHVTVDDVVYKTTKDACIALGFTWYSVEELAERLHLKVKVVHDNVIRAKRKKTLVTAVDGRQFDDCFTAIASLIPIMTLAEMAEYLRITPATIINRYRKYNKTHDQPLPLFKFNDRNCEVTE